jgi:hypothetical protein
MCQYAYWQTIYAFAGGKHVKNEKSHICRCIVCSGLEDKTKSTGKYVSRIKRTEYNSNVMMTKSKCFDTSLSLHKYVSTDITAFIMLN